MNSKRRRQRQKRARRACEHCGSLVPGRYAHLLPRYSGACTECWNRADFMPF